MDLSDTIKKFSNITIKNSKEFSDSVLKKSVELTNSSKFYFEIKKMELNIQKEKINIWRICDSKNNKSKHRDINKCLSKINNLKKQIEDKKLQFAIRILENKMGVIPDAYTIYHGAYLFLAYPPGLSEKEKVELVGNPLYLVNLLLNNVRTVSPILEHKFFKATEKFKYINIENGYL